MKSKLCTKCHHVKLLSEFYVDKAQKDGYKYECKICSYVFEKRTKQHSPWYKHLKASRQRCNDKNATNYKWYGLKGIQCLITIQEIKLLWNRDKAWLFKEAHLSRKNHNDNYTFDNCFFSSKKQNVGESNKRTKSKDRK
jgi:hypothetical protein